MFFPLCKFASETNSISLQGQCEILVNMSSPLCYY